MSVQPLLSVVVAVCDGAATLARALQAIVDSNLPRHSFELIVVDDASADGSAVIAARYADSVIRLNARRSGLAYARNRGAEIARGDAIAFVDADIQLRADTLSRMLQSLRESSGLDAISAVRASKTAAKGLVSEYWALLLHYGDARHSGSGGNLGSGCGMVRKSALMDSGMFDEWRFGTGTLEGVELGQRLARAGHEVLLTSDLQVTPLKPWTVRGALREAFTRSSLLSRSLGYLPTRSSAPGDVVFTLSRAAVPLLAMVSITGLSAAFLPPHDWRVGAVIALAAVTLMNATILRTLAHDRGFAFAFLALPLHLAAQAASVTGLCLGWLMRDAIGDRLPDAATQAYAEVGVEMWPPVPRPR
jgi:hypothetical protein